jgi:hypothetical protein
MSTVVDDKLKRRVLAFVLVLSHLIAGLICCAVSRNHGVHSYQQAVFVGLVFCQPSLVGLWAGLGTNPWWARLVGILVSLIYLGGLFCVGVNQVAVNLVLMIMFAGLSFSVLLFIGRCFGLRIRVTNGDGAEKLAQFSIRQIMLFTLVVACVMGLAKWLAPHVVDPDPHLGMLFFITVPFQILGLAALWSILGTGYPRLGTILVLSLAPLLGFSLQWGLQGLLGGPDIDAGYWITATMTAALGLIVSLYAIRRCGFRVRRQWRQKTTFEGEESHKEHSGSTYAS